MKRKNKIIVAISDKINKEGLILLKKNFAVLEKHGLSNDELLDYFSSLKNKPEVLIIRSTRKLDKIFIKNISERIGIKVICTVSSGFDNIDVDTCKLYKIKAFNVPNGNYISAAEHTFAIILAIYKQLNKVNSELRNKNFITGYDISSELYGKKIGIIGVGRIGSYVAKMSRAFGMKVYGNDIKKSLSKKYKWIKFLNLNTLLISCDIITIHTPLDNSTKNLINKNNIKLVKSSSVIINCARGGIINEDALYNSLKNKKIYFAGLDVYDNEPDINFKFSRLDNVLLTPHIAGKTKESHKRMAIQAAKKIINYYILGI